MNVDYAFRTRSRSTEISESATSDRVCESRALKSGELLRVLHQQVGDGDVKSFGDVVEPLVEQAAPAMLDIDQEVARDAGGEGKLLLSATLSHPDRPDALADLLSMTLPGRGALRAGLAGSGGHHHQRPHHLQRCLPN